MRCSLYARTHSRWAATRRDATGVVHVLKRSCGSASRSQCPFGERKLTHPDRVFSNGVSNASLCAHAHNRHPDTRTRTRTRARARAAPALKTLDEANSKARPVMGFAHMPKWTRPFFPDADGDGRASVFPHGRVAHEAGIRRSVATFLSERASELVFSVREQGTVWYSRWNETASRSEARHRAHRLS